MWLLLWLIINSWLDSVHLGVVIVIIWKMIILLCVVLSAVGSFVVIIFVFISVNFQYTLYVL